MNTCEIRFEGGNAFGHINAVNIRFIDVEIQDERNRNRLIQVRARGVIHHLNTNLVYDIILPGEDIGAPIVRFQRIR